MAPSPRAEAQGITGEHEVYQSHSEVVSLSMLWVPRQGSSNVLLLLISHPFCCRGLGGLLVRLISTVGRWTLAGGAQFHMWL